MRLLRHVSRSLNGNQAFSTELDMEKARGTICDGSSPSLSLPVNSCRLVKIARARPVGAPDDAVEMILEEGHDLEFLVGVGTR
jgi:hypothetical protein